MTASRYLPPTPAFDPEPLLKQLQARYDAWPLKTQEDMDAYIPPLFKRIPRQHIPAAIVDEIYYFFRALYEENFLYIPSFHPRPTRSHLTFWDKVLFPERIPEAEKIVAAWLKTLSAALPLAARDIYDDPYPCSASTIDFLGSYEFSHLFSLFYGPEVNGRLVFPSLTGTLRENLMRAMGHNPNAPLTKPLKLPHEYPFDARMYVSSFLAKTPFPPLLSSMVPFDLTGFKKHHLSLYAHTGHGKSQFFQTLILQHLKEEQSPGLIIIDSESKLQAGEGILAKIERLDYFRENPDRLVVVDPLECPAFNVFDLGDMDEMAQTDAIDLFTYIFTAKNVEMTGRQDTAFNFLMRLMFRHKGATLDDLLQICLEGKGRTAKNPFRPQESRYWSTIQTLDPYARSYFENEFFSDKIGTKEQIQARLRAILSIPIFARMFTAKKNKLNFYEWMEKRKVVLVPISGLGHNTVLFARTIIALAVKAAYQRKIDNDNPCLLFLDEAADIFDTTIETVLNRTRKYGLFLRFATQNYDQLRKSGITAAANSGTTVKLAGGLTSSDAEHFAADMRTSKQFLLSTKFRDRQYAEFACFVRNHTPTAVMMRLRFGQLESEPTMDEAAFLAQYERTRAALRPVPAQFSPGDRVQVTLGGADLYPAGVVVREVREHEGEWFVFVEDSTTGIPEKDIRLFSATTDRTPEEKETPAQDSSGILTPAQAAQPFKPDEDFR